MISQCIVSTAAVTLAIAAADAAQAADLVLDGAAGPYVDARINGVPLRLKVELDYEDGIALNPGAAARAGLGRGNGKWIVKIGPVKLRGRSADAQVELAGQMVATTVHWVEKDAASDADGVIGPAQLPFDTITLERRKPQGAEQAIVFATKHDSNNGVHVPITVGRHRVAVRFSLVRPRSLAPAAAGAVLAAQHGGVLTDSRSNEFVSYGVWRPARALELHHPLRVGTLSVPRIMLRTADWRGDHDLPPIAQSGEETEITVTARMPSQHALYRVTIGLDILDHCSAATYTRQTGRLAFRCSVR